MKLNEQIKLTIGQPKTVLKDDKLMIPSASNNEFTEENKVKE